MTTKYDRLSAGMLAREGERVAFMEELKDSALSLGPKVEALLEPPKEGMVNILCGAEKHSDSDRRKLAACQPTDYMDGWHLRAQLEIKFPHLRSALFIPFGAFYDDGKVMFTRLDRDGQFTGDRFGLEEFASDCVDGQIEALEQNPRYRNKGKQIGFIQTS